MYPIINNICSPAMDIIHRLQFYNDCLLPVWSKCQQQKSTRSFALSYLFVVILHANERQLLQNYSLWMMFSSLECECLDFYVNEMWGRESSLDYFLLFQNGKADTQQLYKKTFTYIHIINVKLFTYCLPLLLTLIWP